jgi:hypothetical protein
LLAARRAHPRGCPRRVSRRSPAEPDVRVSAHPALSRSSVVNRTGVSPFAQYAAFPRSDYYGESVPGQPLHLQPDQSPLYQKRTGCPGSHVPALCLSLDLGSIYTHVRPARHTLAALPSRGDPRARSQLKRDRSSHLGLDDGFSRSHIKARRRGSVLRPSLLSWRGFDAPRARLAHRPPGPGAFKAGPVLSQHRPRGALQSRALPTELSRPVRGLF